MDFEGGLEESEVLDGSGERGGGDSNGKGPLQSQVLAAGGQGQGQIALRLVRSPLKKVRKQLCKSCYLLGTLVDALRNNSIHWKSSLEHDILLVIIQKLVHCRCRNIIKYRNTILYPFLNLGVFNSLLKAYIKQKYGNCKIPLIYLSNLRNHFL